MSSENLMFRIAISPWKSGGWFVPDLQILPKRPQTPDTSFHWEKGICGALSLSLPPRWQISQQRRNRFLWNSTRASIGYWICIVCKKQIEPLFICPSKEGQFKNLAPLLLRNLMIVSLFRFLFLFSSISPPSSFYSLRRLSEESTCGKWRYIT